MGELIDVAIGNHSDRTNVEKNVEEEEDAPLPTEAQVVAVGAAPEASASSAIATVTQTVRAVAKVEPVIKAAIRTCVGRASDIPLKPTDIIIECPHCGGTIVTGAKDVNCAVFRHGVLKRSGRQMGPHTKRAECERLVAEDAIVGCGKPYRLAAEKAGGSAGVKTFVAVACGYI